MAHGLHSPPSAAATAAQAQSERSCRELAGRVFCLGRCRSWTSWMYGNALSLPVSLLHSRRHHDLPCYLQCISVSIAFLTVSFCGWTRRVSAMGA